MFSDFLILSLRIFYILFGENVWELKENSNLYKNKVYKIVKAQNR